RQLRRACGPPGRARARQPWARQSARRRGRLPLPHLGEPGGPARVRHPLPAAPDRLGGDGPAALHPRLRGGPPITAEPRPAGRAGDALRPVTIEPGFVRTGTGSALISCGGTRVICTASVQESVPRWMAGQGRGWMTAEYGMLPASTGDRKQRDVSKGRPDGRTVEIQRLIGRSLRGVADLDALGERTIYVDCDVLEADGGTR